MLGENLRFLRKQAKLSQDDLSKILSIPRTTLGDYERGKTEPNLDMLTRLAAQFNVRVDDLIRIPLQYRDEGMPESNDLNILAITTDAEGRNNIELVETRAAAGYRVSWYVITLRVSETLKTALPISSPLKTMVSYINE